MSETPSRAVHESSAGAQLAAAREELELTIHDVAQHLKLSPAQVEALEEGAYDRLPGRVFVRGFMRNYAKLLGLDPQPLLKSVEREWPQPKVHDEPPPAPEVVMPRGEPVRWPLYVGSTAMLIVLALAVYEFGFNEAPRQPAADKAEPAAPAVATLTPAAPPAPVVPAPGAASPVPATAPMVPEKPAVPAAAPETPAPAAVSRSDGELVASARAQSSQASALAERSLRFRFDQESWVEIRDHDNRVIFSKLNRAGAEEQVSGIPPFKLVVGNARGVRLDYDNKPVDLAPHIGATVARLTLE